MKIFIFSILSLIPSLALSLSLKDAEDAALQNDSKISSQLASYSALEYKKDAVTAGYFPKFSLELSKGHRNHDPKNFNNSSMSLRASFANPFFAMALWDSLAVDKKLLDLEQNTYRNAMLYKIRTSYFKIKLLDLQIEQGRKYLTSLSRIFKTNDDKYKQGRIQVLDRDRSQVELLKQEQTLSALSADKAGQIASLALKINKTSLLLENLTTALPIRFKSITLPSEALSSSATKHRVIEYEKSQTEIKKINSEFLPDFYIGLEKNDIIDSVTETRYLAFVGGLTWKLSPETYYRRKASLAESSSSQNLIDFENEQNKIMFSELMSELNSIVGSLTSQEAIIQKLSSISEKTLAQYEKGFNSFKDYHDDFRNLSTEEDTFLLRRYRAIELYAKIAQLMEDDTVFYSGYSIASQ